MEKMVPLLFVSVQIIPMTPMYNVLYPNHEKYLIHIRQIFFYIFSSVFLILKWAYYYSAIDSFLDILYLSALPIDIFADLKN